LRADQAKFGRTGMRRAHDDPNRLIALRKKTLGMKNSALQNSCEWYFDDESTTIRNKLSANARMA
jgi:hypothetical protein